MKKTFKNNGEMTLDDALLELRRTITESLREKAQKMGQSLAHFEVLKYVSEKGDPTMKSLAEHLRITPPSASALVEGLVNKGFLVRNSSDRDRRTVRISLTAKSQRLFASLHKSRVSIFNYMLLKLSPDDRKQLTTLLARCIAKTKK